MDYKKSTWKKCLSRINDSIPSDITVDEAHRSHNGIEDGSARYLRDAFPNATFIGFAFI